MVEYELNLNGRVAIVTGSGAGLGRSHAIEFAKRGAKVVINDFGKALDGSGEGSTSPADQVVDEIKATGGEAVANYDNVSTAAGGQNIVKTAVDNFGKVDILVNNAGILRDKSFVKMSPEEWQAVIDVHLTGAYNVTRPAFEVMKSNGYGRIVMTSSAAGFYGNFGQANYGSAKMGVIGLMNTLSVEGAKYNIKVNTIAPNAGTRMTEGLLPPDQFKLMATGFTTAFIVYLCSEQCKESANIYNAGRGVYNRMRLMNSQPVAIGDGETVPSAEDVFAHLTEINNMENCFAYENIMEYIMPFSRVGK